MDNLSCSGGNRGTCTRITSSADPEGGVGRGSGPPPPKNHKNLGFSAILVRIP